MALLLLQNEMTVRYWTLAKIQRSVSSQTTKLAHVLDEIGSYPDSITFASMILFPTFLSQQ